MRCFTYNGQCKDGLSQNISALRYWNSDHYPSVEGGRRNIMWFQKERNEEFSWQVIQISEHTVSRKKKLNSNMEHNWLILLRRADSSDWVLKTNAEFRTGASVNFQTFANNEYHIKYPSLPIQPNPTHSISIGWMPPFPLTERKNVFSSGFNITFNSILQSHTFILLQIWSTKPGDLIVVLNQHRPCLF